MTILSVMLRRAVLGSVAVAGLLLAGCDRRDVGERATSTPHDATAQPQTPAGAPPAADRDINAPVATNTPEPPDASETGTPSSATRPAISQADALALLMAVDENEIAAADQALARNVGGQVRDYAQMMKTDHGQNLTDTTRLGGAVSTAPAVAEAKQKGEAGLRSLDAFGGAGYEKAYIDAMVADHTEALAIFDSTLLPVATSANVRQHFITTRATVARHLERAKEIQASLE